MSNSYRYSFISEKEFRSLLYYQGAPENIKLDPSEQHQKEFYSIDNGYETINMLLFQGIENERARLQIEKRAIEDKILDHMENLLEVYGYLYSVMCKYTYHTAKADKLLTYRDDRRHTYQCMQTGMNDSFLSTSFIAERKPAVSGRENYFQKKDGLVLMDVEALDTVEHVDMNDVLENQSKYPDENEVLYPPFLYLDTERMSLTPEEIQLKDIHKKSPYGKVHVMLKGSTVDPKNLTEEEKNRLEVIRKKLIAQDEIKNIKTVWNVIRNGEESEYSKEIEKYCQWKKLLKLYLRETYAQIKYNVLSEETLTFDVQREKMFCKDLKERIDDADTKRKEYENVLKKMNLAEIVTGGIAGFFFTLSMLGYVSIRCDVLSVDSRVIALLFTFICIAIAAACKTLSLKDKVRQRTIAFLDYDMLRTNWTYEKEKTDDSLERCIQRMRQIEEEDNKRCLQYTDLMIQNMSEWEEKVEKIKGRDGKK